MRYELATPNLEERPDLLHALVADQAAQRQVLLPGAPGRGCSSGDPAFVALPEDQDVIFLATERLAQPMQLWAMREDGTEILQLTDGPGEYAAPSWSPDGTRIAFAYRASEQEKRDLYVIDSDGSGLHRLTDTDDLSEEDPEWSPDGQRLVYTAMVNEDDLGGRIRVLEVSDPEVEHDTVAELGLHPDWSPLGDLIVYTGANETFDDYALWLVSPEGTDSRMFPLDEVPHPSQPSWSPDGSWIAFTSASGDFMSSVPAEWEEDIWTVKVDGTEARRVVSTTGNDHWRVAWSPDGTKLMYTADGDDKRGQIALVDIPTGQISMLTDERAYRLMPSWRATPAPN